MIWNVDADYHVYDITLQRAINQTLVTYVLRQTEIDSRW